MYHPIFVLLAKAALGCTIVRHWFASNLPYFGGVHSVNLGFNGEGWKAVAVPCPSELSSLQQERRTGSNFED